MGATLTVEYDGEGITQEIVTRAIGGLRRTGQFTLGRAKYHAPVRAIFKRDRRGKEIPRGRNVQGYEKSGWRYIRSDSQYRAAVASREKRKGVRLPAAALSARARAGNAGGAIVRSGREVTRATPQGGTATFTRGYQRILRSGIGGLSTRYSGHANTLFPVFRNGNVRTTGDFRREGPLNETIQQRGGRSKLISGKRAEAVSGRNDMYSGRGRYELKSRRALYGGRIGGRLRGEIRLSEVTNVGGLYGTWWIYVESPTPYAPDQEFGTVRHRAQPFLRPALYESRKVLRQEVGKAVKVPSRDAIFRPDSRTTSSRR